MKKLKVNLKEKNSRRLLKAFKKLNKGDFFCSTDSWAAEKILNNKKISRFLKSAYFLNKKCINKDAFIVKNKVHGLTVLYSYSPNEYVMDYAIFKTN